MLKLQTYKHSIFCFKKIGDYMDYHSDL